MPLQPGGRVYRHQQGPVRRRVCQDRVLPRVIEHQVLPLWQNRGGQLGKRVSTGNPVPTGGQLGHSADDDGIHGRGVPLQPARVVHQHGQVPARQLASPGGVLHGCCQHPVLPKQHVLAREASTGQRRLRRRRCQRNNHGACASGRAAIRGLWQRARGVLHQHTGRLVPRRGCHDGILRRRIAHPVLPLPASPGGAAGSEQQRRRR